MSEWSPCVKLPITVHVRKQRPGEQHVSTREGITPVRPDDLIMRGVAGEEYPIGRELFERTYRMGEAAPDELDRLRNQCAKLAAALENALTHLEDDAESMGRFCSDEGWTQLDMDRMDNTDACILLTRAALARHKEGAA